MSRSLPASIPPWDTIQPNHDQNHCFLCGRKLYRSTARHPAARTDEHIFPQWLQRQLGTSYQLLHFPNGSTRQYRLVKIPCCRGCNTKSLSILENRIHRAVDAGFDTFVKLPDEVIFQWASKLLYQLLYFDGGYQVDPADSTKGTLRDMTNIGGGYRTLHFFLQSIRIPMNFEGPTRPWTIVVFRTEVPSEPENRFDFIDSPESMIVGIRMNDIGVIASLQDNGSLAEPLEPLIARLKTGPVTPEQFRESTLRFIYGRSLFTHRPHYILLGKKKVTVISLPPGGLSALPLFQEWDHAVFAKYMSHYFQLPFEQCFAPPDKVLTYLGKRKYA